MPRKNNAKFFAYAPDRSGEAKGTRLLGVNHLRKETEDLTVADLLFFLKAEGIDPGDVALHSSFITRTVLSLGVHDIVSAKPIGEPVDFRKVMKIPGIYKLEKRRVSAALVVTKHGKAFFVNDGLVSAEMSGRYIEEKVWKTSIQSPYKIKLF